MKKTIKAVVSVIALIILLSSAGCKKEPIHHYYVNSSANQRSHLILSMDVGETYTVESSLFNGWDIEFDRFELTTGTKGVVAINKNIITAVSIGKRIIYAELVSRKGNVETHYTDLPVAEIYIIDEAVMTPITTAQQLADINNDLSGNYILNADIDLTDWGDWTSMGEFTGYFINRNGYKIKNLTANSGGYAGLFGFLNCAYLEGINLENVNIDLTKQENGMFYAGSLAFQSKAGIIKNCTVEGNIKAKNHAGGFVANVAGTLFLNCIFKGTVATVFDCSDIQFYDNPPVFPGVAVNYGASGGIAATLYGLSTNSIEPIILGCKIEGDITAVYAAGGFVGIVGEWAAMSGKALFDTGFNIFDSTFYGTVDAPFKGDFYGCSMSRLNIGI